MELLKSSSESMLPEAFVTGVAGKSMACGSGDFIVFLRGSSEGLSWMSASEAFRLWAVGGVVVYYEPVPPDDGTRLPDYKRAVIRAGANGRWRCGGSKTTGEGAQPQVLVSSLYSHKIQSMVRELRRWVGGCGHIGAVGHRPPNSEAATAAVNLFAAVALQTLLWRPFA